MTKKKTAAKKDTVQPAPASKATAAAILGRPVDRRASGEVPPGINPKWVKYYKRLLDLREQLLRQMEGLAKESTQEIQTFSVHMADAGTDNFDRDFALSLLSSDQDALYEIEAALSRIEKGTYGICELTGKPIPKARLDAIPWARYTVEAQAQLEREGALRQRKFAQLGPIEIAASAAEQEGEVEEESEEKSKETE
ncbi:MAG: TraR/DksA C4-type zinc finger protein [Verrucomicrobiae bacterium]|nr:TraR/DksA C4-type zinc finger protein [Verrucomicrobiae bacterium]MCX7721829.1 TraR/DksA C4-type zinc finger protein [Verrucomicrobiae bacterium]MDW7979453.1 TraR/DksA C4-type zinc finger protein [Verrucomicrobiales bacterium]